MKTGNRKKALTAVVLAVCMLLAACANREAPQGLQKYSTVRLDLFDTVISLTGYAADEEAFNAVADAVFGELLRLHRLYDVYNEYEGIVNIRALNLHAGEDALEADESIIDLLLLAREFCDATDGRMDAASGSVLRLWHEARTDSLADPENAYLPDEDALREAALHTGMDKVEIDAEKGTVRITDPQTQLDVGAIAKGCAVERVCAMLPDSYLLSAGGNVCATGAKPDGENWYVGIQDPDGDASDVVCRLSVGRKAVVTSGDYQRFYTVDGVRCHHIIDLTTLRPADRWRSVTVICDDSGIADGLSTALFVLPREDGERLLKRYGAEALWIGADGSFTYSEGFEAYMEK